MTSWWASTSRGAGAVCAANQGACTRWSWAQASHPRGAGHTARGVERLGVWRDFNPAADRVRVVSNLGQNLRLHPDTGAQGMAKTAPRAAAPPHLLCVE